MLTRKDLSINEKVVVWNLHLERISFFSCFHFLVLDTTVYSRLAIFGLQSGPIGSLDIRPWAYVNPSMEQYSPSLSAFGLTWIALLQPPSCHGGRKCPSIFTEWWNQAVPPLFHMPHSRLFRIMYFAHGYINDSISNKSLNCYWRLEPSFWITASRDSYEMTIWPWTCIALCPFPLAFLAFSFLLFYLHVSISVRISFKSSLSMWLGQNIGGFGSVWSFALFELTGEEKVHTCLSAYSIPCHGFYLLLSVFPSLENSRLLRLSVWIRYVLSCLVRTSLIHLRGIVCNILNSDTHSLFLFFSL